MLEGEGVRFVNHKVRATVLDHTDAMESVFPPIAVEAFLFLWESLVEEFLALSLSEVSYLVRGQREELCTINNIYGTCG